MSILNTITAYQGPLLILATLFIPSILPRILSIFNPRFKQTQTPPQLPKPPLPNTLIALVILHTLYSIYNLIRPPYDIFTSHNFPILIPNDVLRSTLTKHSKSFYPPSSTSPSSESMNPLIDLLLNRLTTLEPRFLYSRFGHTPLLTCVWCNTKEDFFLASLPGILSGYIGQAMLVGAMGWAWVGGIDAGRRGRRWRGTFGWGLAVVAALELGIRYFWEFDVNQGDCVHLSPMIYTYRQILFALLPPIYLLLPLPTQSSLPTLLPHLQNTIQTLRLLSTSRTAISRSSRLRAVWSGNGQLQGDMGKAGRENESVRKVVGELGLLGGMGDVRVQAKEWVRGGWRGLIRIDDGPPQEVEK